MTAGKASIGAGSPELLRMRCDVYSVTRPQSLFDPGHSLIWRQLQKSRIQAFCESEAQEPLVGCGPGPNCIHLFYKEVCLSAFPTSVLRGSPCEDAAPEITMIQFEERIRQNPWGFLEEGPLHTTGRGG